MVDFNLDLEEINSVPMNHFLTPSNDIYGNNMKQIKSQTYTSATLKNLYHRSFNLNSDASESTNANSNQL